MKVSVIVPCFNEADNIHKLEQEFFPVVEGLVGARLLDNLVIEDVEVVFVDDGSQDSTFAALQSAFAGRAQKHLTLKFEKHAVNRGLGAAIRTGFRASEGDILVTTDSDGTYKFSTIPTLISSMNNGADVITASPYHPQGKVVGVPAFRVFLSRGSSLLYRILLQWNIYTYTALFRGYRREVIEQISFQADDYLAGTELMVKAMLKGYTVAEFPAELHRRVFGISKARLLQTILSHLRFQAGLLLHRLRLRSLFA
ncbi:MAG: glycosyltransferase family 2 protein [Chloroflexota bacterium]